MSTTVRYVPGDCAPPGLEYAEIGTTAALARLRRENERLRKRLAAALTIASDYYEDGIRHGMNLPRRGRAWSKRRKP
jgi:hypothetical protein